MSTSVAAKPLQDGRTTPINVSQDLMELIELFYPRNKVRHLGNF